MHYKQFTKSCFKGPEGKNFSIEKMQNMFIKNIKLTEQFNDRKGVPYYTPPKEKILENTKVVEIPNSGFAVNLHYNNLTTAELNKVEQNIIATHQTYKNLYGLKTYDYQETPELNLYLFDNHRDYLDYGHSRLNLQLTDHNGMTRGYFNGFFDMAVYKTNNMASSIANEVSHAFTGFTGFTTNNLMIGDDRIAEQRSLEVGKLVQEEQNKIQNEPQEKPKIVVEQNIEFKEVNKDTEFVKSKVINIQGTDFTLEVKYDALNNKQMNLLEKYINHIFNAYRAKHGLEEFSNEEMNGSDLKNNAFELKVFNKLSDFQNACSKDALGDYHYYDKSAHVPLGEGSFENTLAHELAHALSKHNNQKSNKPRIEDPEGHKNGDGVYKFGNEVGEELCSIRKQFTSNGKFNIDTDISENEINNYITYNNKGESTKPIYSNQQNDTTNSLLNTEHQQTSIFDIVKGFATSFTSWISSWVSSWFSIDEEPHKQMDYVDSYSSDSEGLTNNDHELI